MSLELEDLCITYMQSLADVAGSNYPAFKRDQLGFMDSLVSSENTSGFEQLAFEQGDGKTKQVVLRSIQPGTVDETTDEMGDICEAGDEDSVQTELVTLTRLAVGKKLTFTKATLKTFCEGSAEFRAKMIMANMNAFFRYINRDLLGLYEAGMGTFYNGVPGGLAGPKTINLLNEDAGGRISADASGEVEIMTDFQNMGMPMNPFVVGAGHLAKYALYQKIGCCNMWGQQVNQLGNFKYYFDQDVDNIIGNAATSPVDINYLLAYAPGTIQFLRHLDNKGEFAAIHEHYAETTAVDPFSGLEFDLEFNYDRCTKTYTVIPYLNYDLWFMPVDSRKETDDRYGNTGSVLYQSALS